MIDHAAFFDELVKIAISKAGVQGRVDPKQLAHMMSQAPEGTTPDYEGTARYLASMK